MDLTHELFEVRVLLAGLAQFDHLRLGPMHGGP